MMQILIVEDEHSLSDAIAQLLRDQHYEVDCVYDGRSGLEYARAGHYDLIILDVMLPQMDGFEVVKTMRREKISTPVLILTARENISDKITGLDCGADDYMTKPFDYDELFARIRALTRRVGEVVLNEITYGDLTLDLERAELRCGEKAVHLGYKEFAIMQRFMQHPQIPSARRSSSSASGAATPMLARTTLKSTSPSCVKSWPFLARAYRSTHCAASATVSRTVSHEPTQRSAPPLHRDQYGNDHTHARHHPQHHHRRQCAALSQRCL